MNNNVAWKDMTPCFHRCLQQLQAQQNPAAAVLGQIRQLQRLILSVTARREKFDEYAQMGILSLEQTLIDALTDAGFEWGGQWQHGKDFMHFQL